MMEPLQQAAAWLMNRVRVNHVQASMRDGAPVFVKRRRATGRVLVWFANGFYALASSGSRMCGRAGEWTDWEVHCVRLLYPGQPAVTVGPGPAVSLPRVDGISLRTLTLRRDPDVGMAVILAARELRRVHQIECSRYNGKWSHGDLHLDNILCDVNAGRAVLIDFDIRHELSLGPVDRQSDDVQVAILELIGLPDERGSDLAAAFIEEYREPAVLDELARQLVVPHGFARLLWYVRTNGAPLHRIEPRLQHLRMVIHAVTSGNP